MYQLRRLSVSVEGGMYECIEIPAGRGYPSVYQGQKSLWSSLHSMLLGLAYRYIRHNEDYGDILKRWDGLVSIAL